MKKRCQVYRCLCSAALAVVASGLGMAAEFSSVSRDRPWENSLGMKFVPVPGTEVLFGVWDVRVRDYEAYAKSRSGVDPSWQNLEFKGQKVSFAPDHPALR